MGILCKIKKDQVTINDVFIQHTLDILPEGKIVVFPLESVYALGGTPFDNTIFTRIMNIFQVNEPFIPILLVESIDFAKKLVKFTPQAELIAKKFWPGNLALMMATNFDALSMDPPFDLKSFAWKDSTTLCIQVSKDPIVKILLEGLKSRNLPPILLAVSAHSERKFTASTTEEIINQFGHETIGIILDSGKLGKGKVHLPNTILKITEEEINMIQNGSIPEEEIQEMLK
jgi:L-threonylcarbamoyladenylate synthase